MNLTATARRLRYLVSNTRRLGVAHAFEVFRQARRRRRYARAPVGPASDELLRAEIGGGSDVVEFLTSQLPTRFPLLKSTRKEFLLSLLERSQRQDDILADAERFAGGEFSALGSTTPSGEYDWHRDWVTGHVWPRLPYHRIRVAAGNGSDIKRPWELSRMYWIAWLGKAWIASGNQAWARDFVRIVDSWRAANPVNVGVNWAMPMEVAIRSFWLVQGFVLFRSSPGISNDWWLEYVRLIHAHGTYLENNLEYFSNLTNHYIANCFGLVSIGAFFGPESACGRRWLFEGRRRLTAELEHQVCPDGTHYERSLPYHRLVLEMYLAASVLLERCRMSFDAQATERIRRMSELLIDVALPDGTIPAIGDADDGVVLRMRPSIDPGDARDLACVAACLFGSADAAWTAREYSQSALLLLGAEGFEIFRAIEPAVPEHSRLYRYGGFATLRAGRHQVVADVGPIGLHGNNDTLSFVLADSSGALIVDPGTYAYTGDPIRRDELRSSLAHNAPVVDRREIAEFDGLWRVRSDRTAPRVLQWQTGEQSASLEADHAAYSDGTVGRVTRRWELDAGGLTIRDRIEGTGEHELRVRFTVAREAVATVSGETEVLLLRASGLALHLQFDRPVTVRRGWYSPRYGVAVETDVIELVMTTALPSELVYICRFAPETPS